MRAFVTGLDGFAGQWLARALLAAGDTVAGGSRNEVPSYSILGADETARMRWHRFDLRDEESIAAALRVFQPDVVYHLAAQSSVGESFADPLGTFDLNIVGTAALLQACAQVCAGATVLCVGSADAYGEVAPRELPLRETTELRPANPYAASKAAAEIVALQFARATPLRVIVTRSFNHTGPGQRTTFAASSFAAQIAAIAVRGVSPVLRVGNLDARRDFTDVRDVVRAYRALVERGRSGEVYNVCSGRSTPMRTIVERLVRASGADIRVEVDPARLRPTDPPEIVGDASRLHETTGWRPEIAIDTMLDDLYRWHAGIAAQGAPR